ncbi:MAG: hypothetical protein WCS54_05655 [Fibrobacteraceae bacterium]
MIDVMKAFYTVHYNFGAISLLLFLLIIFLLTKKNFKWSLIFFAVIIVINVFIYQRTANRSWTVIVPAAEDASNSGYDSYQEEQKYTFSATKNWTIKTEKGEVMHWCWVETLMDKFANIDFVDRLWGTKQAKQLRQASEQRLDQ